VEKKCLNRIVNAIKVGQNGLFSRLVDNVYEPDRRTYLCFSEHVYLDLKSQGPVQNALVNGWEKFQARFPFFTNSFAFCELNGGRYCGPAPKTRVTNSGKLVLTFEWDVEDPKFLDEQIRWTIAGSDKKTALDRLYAHLARYWDFRWLEAVWSGHKSVHLHILLDSRHLSPSRFEGEFPRPPSLIRDVPAHVFRNGVRSCSELLGHLVQEKLAVDRAFALDPDLHYPDWFRRTPWGIRTLHEGNIFGAPAGMRVPQVVLWSKGRSYARTGEDWILQSDRFIEVERQRRRGTRASEAHCAALAPDLSRGFLDELSALCEKLFGPKETSPFPVEVEKGPDGWRIRFRNNLDDRNPGSVMEGHHYTILIGSGDPEIRARRYAFPMSADALVDRYRDTGTLRTGLPVCDPNWSEIQFQEALEWYNSENPEEFDSLHNPSSPWGFNRPRSDCASRISTIPDFILAGNVKSAAQCKRALTVSTPGAGKTSSIIEAMLEEEFDPDQRGFRVIACSSYEQAINKMEEFRRKVDGRSRAVLIRAFNDVYKEVCLEGRLTTEGAAQLGFHSVIEAVYATAPDLAVSLDQHRLSIQRELGFKEDGELDYTARDNVVIFCVHSLIHKWSWAGGSKNWLHPLFLAWREAKSVGDSEQARVIQRAIDLDMRLRWVLYDEISMADLISHHTKDQVDYATSFINATPHRGDVKLAELFDAWTSYTQSHPGGMSFEVIREITNLGYVEADLITLDPAREPYGINNTPNGLYTALTGQQHYAKLLNWWEHLNCRLTVTTTEHKPKFAVREIGNRQRARNRRERQSAEQRGTFWRAKPVWNTFTYDPAGHIPAERMRAQIYLDTRARAPREGQADFHAVDAIQREIHETHPESWIISNIIDGDRVITPRKAKGTNDFIGQKVFYVMMFLAGSRYGDLLIENEVLNLDCAVQLEYLDEFDQMAGRTLGFRYQSGSEFIAIVSPRLWSQISHTLCLESRFRLELLSSRPW
jgi:hypothetical protein